MEETEVVVVLVVSSLIIMAVYVSVIHALGVVYMESSPDAIRFRALPRRVAAGVEGGAVRLRAWDTFTGDNVSMRIRVIIVAPDCRSEVYVLDAPTSLPLRAGYWYIPVARSARTVSVVRGACNLTGVRFSWYGLGSTRGAVHVIGANGAPRLVRPAEYEYVFDGQRWVSVEPRFEGLGVESSVYLDLDGAVVMEARARG